MGELWRAELARDTALLRDLRAAGRLYERASRSIVLRLVVNRAKAREAHNREAVRQYERILREHAAHLRDAFGLIGPEIDSRNRGVVSLLTP